MFKFLAAFKTLLLATVMAASLPAQAQTQAQPAVKVVYHLSEGIPQASRAINNIRNQSSEALSIWFLTNNTAGQSFAGAIGDLSAKGVGFFVCNNTLVSRNIDASKVAMEAKVVPSGVAEVARLQAREGYVYLRP